MKSPSCWNITQSGSNTGVMSSTVPTVPCNLHTDLLELSCLRWWDVMNNIICGEMEGTDGDRNCLPTTLTTPPVRSQPGIFVSLYWCCPSQLSLYFSLTTSGLPLCLQSTPVNSSQQATSSQLSSNHKFLPIIARSGHSQELNKIGWNSLNWSRKSENRCSLCTDWAQLSPLPLHLHIPSWQKNVWNVSSSGAKQGVAVAVAPHPPHLTLSHILYSAAIIAEQTTL